MCRFSDAGSTDLTTRSAGRRPKSASGPFGGSVVQHDRSRISDAIAAGCFSRVSIRFRGPAFCLDSGFKRGDVCEFFGGRGRHEHLEFKRDPSRRPYARAEGLQRSEGIVRFAGVNRQLVRHWAMRAGINVSKARAARLRETWRSKLGNRR